MSAPTETVEVIIPVYNEADNLEKLYVELTRELSKADIPFSVLFVDDGSTDETLEILERMHLNDSRVRFLSLSRNFGQQIALHAGLEHARASCVITMDGDLQHPPHMIPEMINRWREGYQIVSTSRDLGSSVGLFKRVATRVFYRVFNSLSGLHVPLGTADFRLFDGPALRIIMAFPERSKFIRGLVDWAGFRTCVLRYTARERQAGKSKYSLARRLRFVWEGISAFSTTPLRAFLYVGLVGFVSGVVYGCFVLAGRWSGKRPAVSTGELILVAVVVIGSLQLIAIGVIGAYLAKVLEQVQGRPLYVVKKRAT